MTPTFEAQGVKLFHADCLAVLPTLAGVDLIISVSDRYDLDVAIESAKEALK